MDSWSMLFHLNAPLEVMFFFSVVASLHMANAEDGAQVRPECNYDMHVMWTAECGSGVIVATPLIADIDADGQTDIITASFTEEISVIRGDTGQVPAYTHWPFRLPGATFYSSPLLYDIDEDGREEVLVTTSNGEILFLTSNGDLLHGETLKIPHLVVKKYWYDLETAFNPTNINDVIYSHHHERPLKKLLQSSEMLWSRHPAVNRHSGVLYDGEYVSIDAHVLATPVLADLNNDGSRDELIIPITYYFDKLFYSLPENKFKLSHLQDMDIVNYLANGIVIMNLTSGQVLYEVSLDMSKVSAEFPAYQLFTPTVIDLDGKSGPLEIIVCTSAGHINVLDSNAQQRPGFPKSVGTIHGQITVDDFDGDGHMELIVIDNSANVMCLDAIGSVIWETEMSGTSTAGTRVVDLNGDNILDIVISSNDGSVWAFQGNTGALLPGWPHQLGGKLTSNVLITKLQTDSSHLDLIIPGYDGKLYIIATPGDCIQSIELEECSLVQVLSAELIDYSGGLELVMATIDGTIICLSVDDSQADSSHLTEWQSETPTINQFTYWNNKFQVVVNDRVKDVTGSIFNLNVEIQDDRPQQHRWKSYYIMIQAGSYVLGEKKNVTTAGYHQLTLSTPPHPLEGIVYVYVTNAHGQEITTTFIGRFNMQWQSDIQWLVLLPFSSMVLLLLLVFGYPEADLLPTVHTIKDS